MSRERKKPTPMLVRDRNRIWEVIDKKAWLRWPVAENLMNAGRVLYVRIAGEWRASGVTTKARGSSLLDAVNSVSGFMQRTFDGMPQVAEASK